MVIEGTAPFNVGSSFCGGDVRKQHGVEGCLGMLISLLASVEVCRYGLEVEERVERFMEGAGECSGDARRSKGVGGSR